MQDLEFSEIVELICKEDNRFDRKAYTFVRQALDGTVKELKKKHPERTQKSQHVSGGELLDGIRLFALDQYGPLAKTVLNTWGIERCSHFGDIVFNLIEYNVFSKTESDRREDFAEIYSFEDAFVKPFAATRKSRSSNSLGAA
ncbi:MAG TPA: Minf_1886 family protein [Candidatus Didemnitutus sp.]|nr:Minf_1886 family protein [Candidatus Didemnitutus sp.]